MARRRRGSSSKGKRLVYTLAIIAIALAASYLAKGKGVPEQAERGDTVEFSAALSIPRTAAGSDSETIEHAGFTVSYNQRRKNPDWVAYELTAEEAQGTEPRKGDFIPDPGIRGAQGDNDDYRRSGWTRGHHAPAGDMKWSGQAMRESFYLSNISPQNGNLNNGVWKSIEELARDNAVRYGKVLIATGPVFADENGLGTIGKNRILIPNGFYKVLLIEDSGYKGIGFYCDNVAGKKKLHTYARSIDEIESMTGIDFFHRLPDDIEEAVEKEFSWDIWK